MFKKLLFSTALIAAAHFTNAQSTVWMDDFEDQDISDWTLFDDDGDGNNWDVYQVTNQNQQPVTPMSLISRSWQQVPLTPDNWAISPVIDLTNAGGTITLEWITQVAAQAWDEEHYGIYVGTTPDRMTLVNSTVKLEETLGNAGNTGAPVTHTLDISSFAGNPTVYVGIRHFDVTDMDFIAIDHVKVTATILATAEANGKNAISIYPNPTSDVLNLKIDGKINNTKIYDVNGKLVLTAGNETSVSLKSLTSGAYVVAVTNADGKVITKKVIKK